MRLTKEQKLEMARKHPDKGFSFKELADEYHLETDMLKFKKYRLSE